MSSAPAGVCPRCGAPFKRVEVRRTKSNTYYLAVHSQNRKCYLGPGEYKYASLTHENIGVTLRGAVEAANGDDIRVLSYLESYLDHAAELAGEIPELEDVRRMLEKARRAVRELAKRRRQA